MGYRILRIVPFVIKFLIDSPRWSLKICRERRVTMSSISCMCTAFSFLSRTGIIILFTGLGEMRFILEIKALRRNTVAVANWAVSATLLKERLRLVLFTLKVQKQIDSLLMSVVFVTKSHSCPRKTCSAVLNCHNTALFTFDFRLIAGSSDSFGPLHSFLCGGQPLTSLQGQYRLGLVGQIFCGFPPAVSLSTTRGAANGRIDALNKKNLGPSARCIRYRTVR